MSRVAVVMPVYNAEQYLGLAIRSLLEQTHKDFKIFAVNDGSTDNSPHILEKARQNFPNKISIVSQQNQGTGSALNQGFTMVAQEGGYDYATMVSADNIYYNNFLSTFVTVLDHSPEETVMVYGDFNYLDEQNHVIDTVIHDIKDKTDLVNGYDMGAAFMFRMVAKEQAGPYWRRICEDYAMAVKLAEQGDFELVPLVLMGFRVNSGQLTGSNQTEETRAAEYCRRMAQSVLMGKDVSVDGVYPPGVDPWKHRYDYELSLA